VPRPDSAARGGEEGFPVVASATTATFLLIEFDMLKIPGLSAAFASSGLETPWHYRDS
jgi:hypothetical protein